MNVSLIDILNSVVGESVKSANDQRMETKMSYSLYRFSSLSTIATVSLEMPGMKYA